MKNATAGCAVPAVSRLLFLSIIQKTFRALSMNYLHSHVRPTCTAMICDVRGNTLQRAGGTQAVPTSSGQYEHETNQQTGRCSAGLRGCPIGAQRAAGNGGCLGASPVTVKAL